MRHPPPPLTLGKRHLVGAWARRRSRWRRRPLTRVLRAAAHGLLRRLRRWRRQLTRVLRGRTDSAQSQIAAAEAHPGAPCGGSWADPETRGGGIQRSRRGRGPHERERDFRELLLLLVPRSHLSADGLNPPRKLQKRTRLTPSSTQIACHVLDKLPVKKCIWIKHVNAHDVFIF